ncbi:uncharacterized protein LOC126664397 [Mercurialis annua]|uniref:uncharacterized protein LOC126664397 n=1 Tax=Mercurialis annua TaxID=3986 RepID=UPI00215FBC17|nr:uncharacterized protein LOC126664397 [Mercurialis annua]
MSLLPSSKSMDSSSNRALKECDTVLKPAKHASATRRTPSISSSSSFSSCSSSNFPDESPLSPATPLRFSGVPFSWEHLPGIPKKCSSSHRNKADTKLVKLLPLPPPAIPQLSKRSSLEETGIRNKKHGDENFGRNDPFFAAFVECSKDDNDIYESSSTTNLWNGGKVSRSISDRFGFINLYTSCKRTCAVSESLVYIPRSNRTSYDLINARPTR